MKGRRLGSEGETSLQDTTLIYWNPQQRPPPFIHRWRAAGEEQTNQPNMTLCSSKGFVKRMVTCLRKSFAKKNSADHRPLRPRSIGDHEGEQKAVAVRRPRTMVRPPRPPRELKPRPRKETARDEEKPPLPPKRSCHQNSKISIRPKTAAEEMEKQEVGVSLLDCSLEDDVFWN